MKDYKQISSQVDIFLGSIDPISIEHQFSKNPALRAYVWVKEPN